MRRGPKPAKDKVEAKPAVARKRSKDDDGRVRDLEKRLAVALQREAEAVKRDAEGREQHAATAEILRVISSSRSDLQPVFDTIVRSAQRLLRGCAASAIRRIGDDAHLAAYTSLGDAYDSALAQNFPLPLAQALNDNPVSAPVWTRGEVANISDVESEPRWPERLRRATRAGRYRAVLQVPMRRDDSVIGLLSVARRDPGPFFDNEITLLKTFADQAVIAIENVRLFTELEATNRELTTALDQQTATSEILRAISSSLTDVQPVFDTIVQSGLRLLGGYSATMMLLRDDDRLDLVAYTSTSAEADSSLVDAFPMPLRRIPPGERAIHERRAHAVEDVESAPDATDVMRETGRARGWRSNLFVPVIRDDVALGLISITRREPGPFAADQIALLEIFAAQAVIAIENVRLFKELEERNRELTDALDRQTATADILRVISRSPTEIQQVFDTIVRCASRLCAGHWAAALRFDGELIHLAAQHNIGQAAAEFEDLFPCSPSRRLPLARAILERELVHIADAAEDPDLAPGVVRRGRSFLVAPMLREGAPIGAIAVSRPTPGPFPPSHIELLRSFADQAVIAIENVRLFTELRERNRDLTEALDRQTATAEVLRVISQSQTDVQPVFDAIVDKAIRLFRGWSASIFQSDGQLIHLIAARGGLPGSEEYMRGESPWPIHGTSFAARCLAARTVIHIPDIASDLPLHQSMRDLARTRGWRSLLAAPMLRDRQPIGVITIARGEVGSFSPVEIELLQAFADQAVIAIENARLLGELQARTGELTRSVGELRALGAVSQALSSTLDVDVVLDTIVTRANDLIGADGCTIFEYDEVTEQFHLRATRNLEPRLVELARGPPLREGDQGVLGQLPMGRHAVQVPDITGGSYSSPISDALIEAGYRAVVAVPLIREDHLIGALTVNRKTPGEFSHETIELLQTFATQSALAIQNARLFREIADKSRQLEAASQHKSEFLANMSHELRTPLNAIIGFSEVLSERMFGELNEKQEEYLKDIHASGQHLLSLINDVLDLSKIEAGRMELELTDVYLAATLDNALALVRERAGRRGIGLHIAVDERLGQIKADERKIRQVVLNLLSNAIKFTPEGGRIEVQAKPVNETVEVSVTDTGVGIAPEDREAIFEEFRQVGTAAKKVEGTGLGLALSWKFIELHGGRIWVQSQVEAGSTFTFTIPVRRGG